MQLERFLYFQKIPQEIWDAVQIMSKVSARAAETIYTISKKGDDHINALINIADEIKNGAGCVRIEKMVNAILNDGEIIDKDSYLSLPDGTQIGKWTRKGINFSEDMPINQKKLGKNLVQFFEKQKGGKL